MNGKWPPVNASLNLHQMILLLAVAHEVTHGHSYSNFNQDQSSYSDKANG